MATKEEIRPIYTELQGYLSQAPSGESILETDTPERGLWVQPNKAIAELNQLTGDDYSRFEIVHKTAPKNPDYNYVHAATYRTNLSGLIMRLYGKYFSDEANPFSGTPTTIFSQQQEQSQSFQVKMLLEVQSKIDEKLYKLDDSNKKEKGFMEKVKSSLSSIRSVGQLLSLLLSTAKEFGLSIDDLKELFM